MALERAVRKCSFRFPVPVAWDGEASVVGLALLLILLANFLQFHHSFPEPSVPLFWQKQSMKRLRRGTRHFSGGKEWKFNKKLAPFLRGLRMNPGTYG